MATHMLVSEYLLESCLVLKKLSTVGLLLLCPVFAYCQAQLEMYTSPDAKFRFLYPDTYELLQTERLLSATQGRNVGIPVCDLLSALVCLIYPFDRIEDTNFEAAAFSVNQIGDANTETGCLRYSDLTVLAHSAESPSSSVINGRAFREARDLSKAEGHVQSVQRYRSFHDDSCYELRIAVSVSDSSPAKSPSDSGSPASADAEKARDKLMRVLSTFSFLK